MTSDQQFFLAVLAVIVNVIGLYLNFRKSDQTHAIVNNMARRKSRRAARLADAAAAAAATDNKTAASMATRPLKNRPAEAGRGYSDV